MTHTAMATAEYLSADDQDVRSPRELPQVLYVSPLAHYEGHLTFAAMMETKALEKAGLRVSLLTFQGLVENQDMTTPHAVIIKPSRRRLLGFLARLRRHDITRTALMFVESLVCLVEACALVGDNKKVVLFVRDGDPYLFLPHLLGTFLKNRLWIVSVMGRGGEQYRPLRKVVWSRLWRPFVFASLSGGSYLYVCQNEVIKSFYSTTMASRLREKVFVVPVLARNQLNPGGGNEQVQARRKLGLPEKGFVLLDFGAVHRDKDFDSVMMAVKSMEGVTLVHAGKVTSLVDYRLASLMTHEFKMDNRYVPEAEKNLYFAACDAVVLSYRRGFQSTPSMLWEACSYLKPVVASDAKELRELVTSYGTGFVFEAGNPVSMREAIQRMKSASPEKRASMIFNCRTFSDDFSAEKWGRRMVDLVSKLVECQPEA